MRVKLVEQFLRSQGNQLDNSQEAFRTRHITLFAAAIISSHTIQLVVVEVVVQPAAAAGATVSSHHHFLPRN